MTRLVSVGDVVVDLVMYVPALPARGGDVLASSSSVVAGGALNVLVAAARQGLACRYGGAHGRGPFGDIVRAALAAEGIEAVHAPEPDLDTGVTVAAVDAGGERTFLTVLGAEARLGPEHLDAIDVAPGDLVHVSGYGLGYPRSGPALAEWIRALPGTVTVLTDPGPLVGEIPAPVLEAVAARTDWWSAGAGEARVLTGSADPAAAARALAAGRARAGAVVRTGADGCVVALTGGESVSIPAPAVTAVDANGAGDAHVGAFLAGLAGGLDPEAAARRATIAAALAVTRRGPGTGPTREEVDELLGAGRAT